ncbi:hypothetical protein B0681_06750 [Moraxella porci DSM 25326]|uniref:Uncharacterized protein n=1 Tax=Moraxella porci DSM 25326 TaxID=573983 RepID=A0A1T0CQ66_9GAMM|nr:hypothetical protein B0681_06750 [Moraxella porci DSM 25326]
MQPNTAVKLIDMSHKCSQRTRHHAMQRQIPQRLISRVMTVVSSPKALGSRSIDHETITKNYQKKSIKAP